MWQIGAARDLEQNIVMSRVKNGPFHEDNGTSNQLGSNAPFDIAYYNRNLTEICEEVQANNFDMFISIHSNAATEGSTANYPLYLYRGYDEGKMVEETGVTLEHQQISREMAKVSWPYAFANTHAVWTSYSNTSMNLRGDINFYGSSSTATRNDGTKVKGYLGVLKHSSLGFLVEGYFHTYTVARHRAMNWDVCRLEGNAYARGIADYYGLKKESFGTVYGIVRDMHEKFTDVNYLPNPSSDDIYKPLNGATAKLMKGDEVVAEKVTDNFYNGAFVFDGIEPGTYTLVVTHPDYKTIALDGTTNEIEVVVKAATDTYPKMFLEATAYEPPKEVFETYPDPASTINGVDATTEYNFKEAYADKAIEALEGKTVRRTLVHKDKVYTLALDEEKNPTIVVVDAETGDLLAEVSTEGMTTTVGKSNADAAKLMVCSDIAVSADHFLIASNLAGTTFSSGGNVTIYKWENDENGLPTGEPKVWLEQPGPGMSGNYNNAYAGASIAIDGTTEDGTIYVTAQTTASENFRVGRLTLTAGMVSANEYTRPVIGGTAANYGTMGADTRLYVSPVNEKSFILAGSGENTVLGEYKFISGANDTEVVDVPADLVSTEMANVSIFKFAGASYVAVPMIEEGENVGVTILDITNGMDKAVLVGTTNTGLDGVAGAGIAAGNVGTTYDNVNEVYTNAWLNLYAMRDNKLTKLTTRNVAQPVYKAGMAYNLESTVNEYGDMIVSYAISTDAKSANLVLTALDSSYETEDGLPEAGAEMTYAVEATAGEHTFTVPASDLEEGMKYNYRIDVTSSSPSAGEIFADNNGLTGRGGVITITDETQPSYGYTVVLNSYNNGVDIYNPAGEKVGDKLWKNHTLWQPNTTNQSNPFRGHEREGKAVAVAWGDGACGLVVVDPLANDEPYSLYAGEKAASGAYMYEGKNLGGGHAGICFVGTGEDTKLYAFSEDHAGTTNTIVRYDIGTSWQITEAPVEIGYTSFLANQNVEMLGYGNGFWVAQVRGAGNNAAGCPCFAYISTVTNEDGTITDKIEMTSAAVEGIDNNVAGIAITKDGKILAAPLANSIAIMDVEWNGNTPTATLAYTIPTAAESWAHARFDAANNLHVYSRSNGGYHVYALKGEHVASTQASTNTAISGILNVATDNQADGEAVYYNLNGVRVNGNMVPGVYVKVVNGNATKVVVK